MKDIGISFYSAARALQSLARAITVIYNESQFWRWGLRWSWLTGFNVTEPFERRIERMK